MPRSVTATEARVNFGELMRRVVEHDEAVVVERAGTPQVVVLSCRRYAALTEHTARESALAAIERARHVGERIRLAASAPLPPPEDVLQQGREQRDVDLGLR